MTDVKIVKVNPKATLPVYQTSQAAGMDICACIDKSMTLQPMERAKIPTGLAVELPVGYEMQIRARSSMGFNYGITMVNGVGTIDSDYRGEVGVLLINLGNEPFVIEPNMRIAQMIVSKYEHVSWQLVDKLSETTRGKGGFGSTGR